MKSHKKIKSIPKRKQTPAPAPKKQRPYAFMTKLLYGDHDPRLDTVVDEEIDKIFGSLYGNELAPNTGKLASMQQHIENCKNKLGQLNTPTAADLRNFAKEAEHNEPQQTSSMHLSEKEFKAKVRTAARRVVTCLLAATTRLDRLEVTYTDLCSPTDGRLRNDVYVPENKDDFASELKLMEELKTLDFDLPTHNSR
jgi:hypothetical protein